MKQLLKNGMVFHGGRISRQDVLLDDGIIAKVSPNIVSQNEYSVMDCSGLLIVPGFADVHVHLREPGFSVKETIRTGTMAAAAGGYTVVCAMPNLNPAPDSVEHLQAQWDIIHRDAVIRVLPYASITIGQKGEGELVDFEALKDMCFAFSDDGKGVQRGELMREAMQRVHALGGMIVAHCEVDELLKGGYIHDGEYAKLHGHRGICSESEWAQIARDIELVRETGCRYHVCHISCKESVDIIRKAKAEGMPVTCETGPHYLTMCDMDIGEDGRFKMNPPIRSAEDRDALVQGLIDGTIDVIATDHAPHTAEEKSRGLEKSLMGVVGLETAFPILNEKLVATGVISLETLIDKLAVAPRKLFGFGTTDIAEGERADLAVLDTKTQYTVDPETFLSMGRATPFAGMTARGGNRMTIVDGRIVWQSSLIAK